MTKSPDKSGSTAQQIVHAALETLQEEGFAGASSRAIARRGDFNQALIFYHHGSLENLLVTAMTQTSNERLARYREAVNQVKTLPELIATLADLWAEDKTKGHVRVVSQVIAGSVDRPELSARVVELMEPWIELAEETFARLLPEGLPTSDLAYAAVVWYVGVNLMTHLDGEQGRTDALFAQARAWAPLLDPVLATASAESPDRPSTSPDQASAT